MKLEIQTQPVTVRNLDIEFGQLVGLLVKFAFALIPAAIVIATICLLAVIVFKATIH